MTEHELNIIIEEWRTAEDIVRVNTEVANDKKATMIEAMHQLGLKSQDAPMGKVTLSKMTRCNVVVDRKEFESTLQRKGMYDLFCSTKFDLDKVKKYVADQDDDLYGMVELEDVYSARFTAAKQSQQDLSEAA